MVIVPCTVNMASIPDTVLNQLKCSACKSYLSVGPVTQTILGYHCGRCLAPGAEANSLFETLAKAHSFPCRYVDSGCKFLLPFGEEMLNHEKICEYRIISCPVVSTCEWTGPATNSFVHCSEEHEENIPKSSEFEVIINLSESMNTKMIQMRPTGEMLLLHLMYSEDAGLSINIKKLLEKNRKESLYYNVQLESSERLNMTTLNNNKIDSFYCLQPSSEWIPYNALICLDKRVIFLTITVKVEINPDSVTEIKCFCCQTFLPLNILKCANSHRYCDKCYKTGEQCMVCDTDLQVATNYHAVKTDETILGCCNVLYGCTFSSSLRELVAHEATCTLRKCLFDSCNWQGLENSYAKHLSASDNNAIHVPSNNKILLSEATFNNNAYLITIPSNHCSYTFTRHNKTATFIVKTLVDNINKTIVIFANYVESRNIQFVGGCVEVTLGKDFVTYEGNIGKMVNSTFDRNSEIVISRSLFKQHSELTIELVECRIHC